jgi:hypothetical protein
MSYFASNGYRQPRPYIETDKYAKVPGWGMSLEHAGPPMIAVGMNPDGIGAVPKLTIAKATVAALTCEAAQAQSKLCSEGKLPADVCGRADSKVYDCLTATQPAPGDLTAPGVASDSMSTWVWVACGGIILGAIGLFAYNQGWIGGKKTVATAMTANRWLTQKAYTRRMVKKGLSKVHARALYKVYLTKKVQYAHRRGLLSSEI